MSRVDQVNSLLLRELANLVSQNIYLQDALITITYVECSPDLRYANIGVSVLPEKFSGTAIKILSRKTKELSRLLQKKVKIKFIPKLNWKIDDREKYAADLEKYINEVNS